MPSRSFTSMSRMRFSLRLKPKARRNSSASPPLKPAAIMAMRSSCSWNSGTPSVRSSTGSSEGCGYTTFCRPCRRSRNGFTIWPTIGPGRMIATCTTMS